MIPFRNFIFKIAVLYYTMMSEKKSIIWWQSPDIRNPASSRCPEPAFYCWIMLIVLVHLLTHLGAEIWYFYYTVHNIVSESLRVLLSGETLKIDFNIFEICRMMELKEKGKCYRMYTCDNSFMLFNCISGWT